MALLARNVAVLLLLIHHLVDANFADEQSQEAQRAWDMQIKAEGLQAKALQMVSNADGVEDNARKVEKEDEKTQVEIMGLLQQVQSFEEESDKGGLAGDRFENGNDPEFINQKAEVIEGKAEKLEKQAEAEEHKGADDDANLQRMLKKAKMQLAAARKAEHFAMAEAGKAEKLPIAVPVLDKLREQQDAFLRSERTAKVKMGMELQVDKLEDKVVNLTELSEEYMKASLAAEDKAQAAVEGADFTNAASQNAASEKNERRAKRNELKAEMLEEQLNHADLKVTKMYTHYVVRCLPSLQIVGCAVIVSLAAVAVCVMTPSGRMLEVHSAGAFIQIADSVEHSARIMCTLEQHSERERWPVRKDDTPTASVRSVNDLFKVCEMRRSIE